MSGASTQCLGLLNGLLIAHGEPERQALIAALAHPLKPTILSFLNQHGLNLAWSDAQFRTRLASADYLLRDGVGVSACLRMLGRRPGLNLNGTELIPDLMRAFSGRRALLCGTVQPYLGRAGEAAAVLGCKVAAMLDGFHPDGDYVDAVCALKPDLVVLGMGMPKQERVAAAMAEALGTHPCLLVNGGAIFDFLGGRFPRAPKPVRALRLEWAFRLALEPQRLAGRYLLGGTTFAWRTLTMMVVKE